MCRDSSISRRQMLVFSTFVAFCMFVANGSLSHAQDKGAQAPASTSSVQGQSSPIDSIKPVEQLGNGVSHLDDPALAPSDIREILHRKKLIVAQHREDVAGFHFPADESTPPDLPSVAVDGRRMVGIDISLAKLIAHYLDVELEIRQFNTSYDDIAVAVARGDADLGISNLSITPRRSKIVQFSTPYAQFGYIALSNRLTIAQRIRGKTEESSNLPELLNRSDISFAQVPGTSNESVVQDNFPEAKIEPVRTSQEEWEAAASGRAQATLLNTFDLALLTKTRPEILVYLEDVTLEGNIDKLAVAVAPNRPTLLTYVNSVVQQFGIKTSAESVLQQYYGGKPAAGTASTSGQEEQPPEEITGFFIVAAVLAGLLLVWAVLAWPRRIPADGSAPSAESPLPASSRDSGT